MMAKTVKNTLIVETKMKKFSGSFSSEMNKSSWITDRVKLALKQDSLKDQTITFVGVGRIKNAEDGLTVQKTLNIIPLSNLLILEILFDKVGDKIGTDDSARGDGSDSKPLPDLLHRRG
ncbi:hypothetical protein AAEZ42_03335 [Limosilactobacillus fermentum]